MASERIQRRIGLLLDEADEAVAQGDWALVRDCSQKVLVVDPENQEALTFLAIAERGLGTQDTSSLERAPVPSAPTPAPAPPDAQPTSFANGRYEVKRFLGEGGKMVTGRPPFLGDDSVAIIGQHINTPPVAPTSDRGRYGRKSGCDTAWEGAEDSGILLVSKPKAGEPPCAFPENAIRCKKRLKRIYLTSPSHN